MAVLLGLLQFGISKYLVSSIALCTLDGVRRGLAVSYLVLHHCNIKSMHPELIPAFGDEGFGFSC